MRRGRGLGEAVAMALAFASAAVAQEYSFRLYGPEGGLYRYDGTRFRLIGQAEGLPCSTEVHGLFVASDGALWVNICARVFRFDGQGFQAIQGIDGLLRGAQVMADGAGGGILITTPAGLYEASRGAGRQADARYPATTNPAPRARQDSR